MTIEHIAKQLNMCANRQCGECPYKDWEDEAECQGSLILDMAEECRRIAEEVEDDKR